MRRLVDSSQHQYENEEICVQRQNDEWKADGKENVSIIVFGKEEKLSRIVNKNVPLQLR